jgi:hypothetical protein
MPNENPTHILQTKCQRAAGDLSAGIKHRCAVTLIAFYKEVSATGWGYASALPDLESIVLTLEATIAKKCGAPLPPRDTSTWLPATEQVKQLAAQAREALPFSCGFVLIFGAGVDSVYASFEEAPRMLEFLSHLVLPTFKAQQSLAPMEAGTHAR